MWIVITVVLVFLFVAMLSPADRNSLHRHTYWTDDTYPDKTDHDTN